MLVSEVMLQQTQASRVIPKWHAFLERFPDPTACATAPAGAVIEAWAGLGYNRRGLALHRCAQTVVAEHDGRLPGDLDAAAGPARHRPVHGPGGPRLRLRTGRGGAGHPRRPHRGPPGRAPLHRQGGPGGGRRPGADGGGLGVEPGRARSGGDGLSLPIAPVRRLPGGPDVRLAGSGAGPRRGLGRGVDAPVPLRGLRPPGPWPPGRRPPPRPRGRRGRRRGLARGPRSRGPGGRHARWPTAWPCRTGRPCVSRESIQKRLRLRTGGG